MVLARWLPNNPTRKLSSVRYLCKCIMYPEAAAAQSSKICCCLLICLTYGMCIQGQRQRHRKVVPSFLHRIPCCTCTQRVALKLRWQRLKASAADCRCASAVVLCTSLRGCLLLITSLSFLENLATLFNKTHHAHILPFLFLSPLLLATQRAVLFIIIFYVELESIFLLKTFAMLAAASSSSYSATMSLDGWFFPLPLLHMIASFHDGPTTGGGDDSCRKMKILAETFHDNFMFW